MLQDRMAARALLDGNRQEKFKRKQGRLTETPLPCVADTSISLLGLAFAAHIESQM